MDDGFIELTADVDPLHPDLIFEEIGAQQSRIDLEIHRTIGSTNDLVLQRLEEPGDALFVCLSEMQSAGKGRRGRNWISPFGQNIYLSVGTFLKLPPASLGGLSIVAGIQVVDVLRGFGLKDVGLKWPNDVLMGMGKLAGILVELKAAEKRGTGVVVGIGINLAITPEDASKIDQAWSHVSGQLEISRNALAGRLIERIVVALDEFRQEGFGPFTHRWADYNLFAGEQVTVLRGDEKITGIDRGIDPSGHLVLETESGRSIFNSGEVSVRLANKT